MFSNPKLLNDFLDKGYVVFPLLSESEVYEISCFYNENFTTSLDGFHSTHFLEDEIIKRKVQSYLKVKFEDKLADLLPAFSILFVNFMVKGIGNQSVMPLHADWTYVNESSDFSLGVWCPLIDTNINNGMLGVVPFSHHFKINERGPKIPSPFHNYNQYIIDNYGKLLPLKAGEIVIYNHRLLHFSPPNLSNNPRLAINLVLRPKGKTLYHFAKLEDDSTVHVYQPEDENFYLKYSHFKQPPSNFIEKRSLTNNNYTQEYIDQVLDRKSFISSILNKFKKLFH